MSGSEQQGHIVDETTGHELLSVSEAAIVIGKIKESVEAEVQALEDAKFVSHKTNQMGPFAASC
ncbi:MAG: hypothetical protein ABIA92_05540 [Patescibacteria group bacterium]